MRPPQPPKPPLPQLHFPRLPLTETQQHFWLWMCTSTVAVALYAVYVPLSATLYGLPVLAAFAVGLLQCGSIPLAVVAPRWAIAASIAGFTVFVAFSTVPLGAPWPRAVPSLLSVCALLVVLGLRERASVAIAAWLLSAVASLQVLFYPWIDLTLDGVVANLVTTTATSALALLVAILITQREGIRGELAVERLQTASELERRVIVEERNRIARELHDVVAHSMSVIQVQASSAPYRLAQLDEEARGEFGEIAASARAALQEMRLLLGVLRSEDASSDGMPQPGIFQIAELVPSIDRAGITVIVDIDPELPGDGLASTAAYRIAQESLSNVVRHAPGARASVRAEFVDGAIVLCIENDAPAGPINGHPSGGTPQTGGGHGLIGMRERCSILSGRLHAGPTAGGGFRVLATLPIAAAERRYAPAIPTEAKGPTQP